MRTIMMDVDGVLVTGRPADGGHVFTDLEKDLGIAPALLQQEFFKPHWFDIVTGRLPIEPALSAVLSRIAPAVTSEALMQYWFDNDSRVDQEVLAAIGPLRERGDRVFLATNQEHRRAGHLMNVLALGEKVDGIFYSAALGCRKPSQEFYLKATRASGADVSTIVLIDDTLENVVAAREFGWSGVHWKRGMTVLNELAALN